MEQLIRGTLALSRRALGPSYKLSQGLLKDYRAALDLSARRATWRWATEHTPNEHAYKAQLN